MDFANIKSTILKISYNKPQTSSILANELTNCFIFLLSQKKLTAKIPEIPTSAISLHKTVVATMRPRAATIAKELFDHSILSYEFKESQYGLGAIVKAPFLDEDRKEVSVVELNLPALEDTRYKTEEALIAGEVNKFMTACQVLSVTGGSTVLGQLSFPVLKSHAKLAIKVRFTQSKSDKLKLYLFVPQYVREVCVKYCPDAISTKSLAEINADEYVAPEAECPW